MKILFVGGPKDGLRIEVENPRGYMVFDVPIRAGAVVGRASIYDNYERVVYRLVNLGGHSRDGNPVYLLSEMTADDLLRNLIDRYPIPFNSNRS